MARIAAMALSLHAAGVGAQDTRPDTFRKPDPARDGIEEPEWREEGRDLPDFPREEDLVEVDVLGGDGYRYAVDPASIVMLSDGVLRYTMRIESARGATNYFHEGIRCETREVKTYGYGTGRETFRPVADGRWTPVKESPRSGPLSYRRDLADRYVCHPDGGPRTAENVRRLVLGQRPRGAQVWNRHSRDN
ncbi:MAG: hypothetical protein H6983_13555 [Ectothiorhodospiraceae bacterium]|nr:hypothetical protein [Ectothiorhodospiraceae bacterium]